MGLKANRGLFRNCAQRNTQHIGHALAIIRIGFQTVADVADLDHLRRVAHRPAGVFTEELPLGGAHQAEELAGLGEVVVIVLAEIPMICVPFQLQRRFGEVGLLLPLAVAVWFVVEGTAVIAVNPSCTVTVIAVVRTTGRIDRDLVVVYAEAVPLGVTVGKEPPLEHLVGRETDAGHDIGRIEGGLFDLGEIVLRVFVQLQDPHLDQGIILVVPDLGQVEGIVGAGRRILLRHDLHREGPAGEVFLLDAFVEVPLVAFPVLADERLGLLVGQVLDPLLRLEVEFDPEALVLGVDEAEGVAAEAVHVAEGGGDPPIAHDNGDLVERLRQGCPEVPVVLGAPHVGTGVPFHGVVEVGKLERIAQEEDRRVVPHQVPVALLGVELHGEAPDVPLGVGRPTLAGDGGEAQETVGLLADLGEDLGAGVLGNVAGNGEGAVGTGALGVHPPFWDYLPVEVGHFFQEPGILQELRPARPSG